MGLVALLEFSAVFYVYQMPRPSQTPAIFPSTTSTTSKSSSATTSTKPKAVDHILVESAVISNGTLMMKVDNLGPSETNLLNFTGICTPGFQTCYNYKKLAGAFYVTTFILPVGRTFMANLTGVCTVPVAKCKGYFPIENTTYYLQAKFTFYDGQTVLVPVSAMDNNTWTSYTTSVTDVWPSMTVVPVNLTGMLNVTIGVNQSTPYASFTTSLDGFVKPTNPFSGVILSNETGCTNSGLDLPDNFSAPSGSFNYTTDCSDGTMPILVNFATVTTGIAPGSYYLLVVKDTTDVDRPAGYPNTDQFGPVNFACWITGVVNDTS